MESKFSVSQIEIAGNVVFQFKYAVSTTYEIALYLYAEIADEISCIEPYQLSRQQTIQKNLKI